MLRMKCFLRWVGSAAVVVASGVLLAQDDAKEKTGDADDAATTVEKTDKPKKIPAAARSQVAKELAKLDTFNAEPNWKAKFYIYLYSASWCGPCKHEMPKIVEKYPEMKKKGVEIVLLGCDKDREAAEKYLKDFNAPFPGIMRDDGKDLPGFESPSGIPYAVLVTNKGKVIVSEHAAAVIGNWEDYISKKVKAHDKKKDEEGKKKKGRGTGQDEEKKNNRRGREDR